MMGFDRQKLLVAAEGQLWGCEMRPASDSSSGSVADQSVFLADQNKKAHVVLAAV